MARAFEKALGANPALQAGLGDVVQQSLAEATKAFTLIDTEILRNAAPTYAPVEFFQTMTRVIDAQFALLEKGMSQLQQLLNGYVATRQQHRNLVWAGIGVLLALAVGLSLFIVRSITRPMAHLVGIAEGIAAGSLDQAITVTARDETGRLMQAMQTMSAKLRQIVGEIHVAANQVSTASREIVQGNSDLSQRTQEQASALEETAASMEQMTGTVKQNADNARQAYQLATTARVRAEHGGDIVRQAVTAMAEITHSSTQIADITSVIDSLAFQTNLLALNAAVEAARAGEQGRGFAVVAAEVRKLAQRSAEAAKDIKNLITTSTERVASGSQLVANSGQALDEIVTAVKKVNDIVAEISTASQEQATGIEQVNKAVMQMDEMTQQNAALVEEAAAASEAVETQAQTLRQLLAFFTVETRGEEAPARMTAVAPGSRLIERSPTPERAQPTASPRTGSTVQHRTHQYQERQRAGTPTSVASAAGDWQEF